MPTTDELEPGQQVIVEVVVEPAAEQGPDPRHRAGVAPGPAAHARARRRDGRARHRRADEADVPARGARGQAHRRPAPPPPSPARPVRRAAIALANSPAFVDSAISEIGVGGALLTTTEPLPLETELTRRGHAAGRGRADRDRGPRLVSRAVGRLGPALRQPRWRRRSPPARADPPAARVVKRRDRRAERAPARVRSSRASRPRRSARRSRFDGITDEIRAQRS